MPSLVEIGPVVLEKKIFSVLSMYFCYFVIISPWNRVGLFIWTNLNPLHPRMLSAKFGWNWSSGSWEEGFIKFCQCNFTISPLSPLGEERGPAFEQTWIPSTQGCFVPSLVEIGQVILEKKLKMWKVYRRTDRQTTDDRQQVIRKAHLSFQLRWAKK